MSNNKLIDFDERIFIAGSSGMAGSAIKRALIASNYGNPELNGKLLCPTRKELNLLNYPDVEKWFKQNKPTVVIIAAAKVGGIKANSTKPSEFIIENLKIQTNIIEIAFLAGVKRLLFLGSSCIYPKFSKQPIKEEYLLEGNLEKTNEFYAIAKIAGIKLCESLRNQYKFDAISLMPTNLYGPGDNYHYENSHVMASLIRKFDEAKKNNLSKVICWGSGNPMREFLYVEDLADACIYTLEHWNPSNDDSNNFEVDQLSYINVGSNFEISIKDLAIKIAKIIGFTGKIEWDITMPDGTPRKKLNIEKLSKLGWEAKTNLENGIKLTYEKYLQDFENNLIRKY